MLGFQLTFFTQQNRRHCGMPLGQWLLEVAHDIGIRGATLMGAQLVLGVLLREAALLCTGLMLAFSVAVASALLRHLKIDCGCFGAGTSPATVMTLVRDLGLLGLSGLLLWLSSLSSARR